MSKSIPFCDHTHGVGVATMFPDQVKQKTFLLVGLKRGDLAATTADALAYGGAGTIIFTGLSQRELQPVIDHLNRKHRNVTILFVPINTASLSSVRDAAETIKKMGELIDGFKDGNESHFQQNYLTYFLLIRLLMDVMASTSRIVVVTTSLRNEAPAPTWEDVWFAGGETYHCLDGYAQSMLANIQFVKSLAKIGKDRSMSVFSANPGNTKTNVQTYVSWEEISSWLQLRREAGEDLPILLQQAPNRSRKAVPLSCVDCSIRSSKVSQRPITPPHHSLEIRSRSIFWCLSRSLPSPPIAVSRLSGGGEERRGVMAP
ncbi:uncharacterized protein N7511_003979 [Penicillium nucicola]|uniref:uncharacterized protein n=1 Tax=Penicillium nucicola TaxID=1850975 RepID=UPI002545A6E9|nr:uncharacterized protein N7511_003979 [Penicillium nucicola]KAJ5766363.1 hypothetical protein N7511_003979 [Penicillium nucicola]